MKMRLVAFVIVVIICVAEFREDCEQMCLLRSYPLADFL